MKSPLKKTRKPTPSLISKRKPRPGRDNAQEESSSGGGSRSGGKNFKATYRAYEIIPPNSPYSHHFRTLLNAENFINQKEFEMALDLYQRMLNKIPVRSSREKIQQNIEDIEGFMDVEEETKPPQVSVDIRYVGPGPSATGEEGAPGPGSALPVQITSGSQVSTIAEPSLPPGATEAESKPFGFFMQSLQAPPGMAPGAPAKDFEFHEPPPPTDYSKRSADALEDISKSVFNIEKAMFKAAGMEVETQDLHAPGQGGQGAGGGGGGGGGGTDAGAEAGGGPGAEKAKEGPGEPGWEEEPYTEELRESHPEEEKPEGEEEPPEPQVRGMAGEDEKSEGVMSDYEPIGALDEQEEPEEEFEEETIEPPPVQEIRGVLELREPEQEDTPFITLTYDFSKIPHHYSLSKDHNILEYAYYKYKPMLMKAQKFIRKKQITKALNYYRVIRDQQIPDTLRKMVDKNIQDISEYLEKYLMTRPG